MDFRLQRARSITRRMFFKDAGIGIGSLALASLLPEGAVADNPKSKIQNPKSHRPKAKSVIYLHMSGAPPTLDMFDYKPKLNELNMQPCPESLMKGERFAFIKGVPKMLGSPRTFKQYGQSRAWVCDSLPHMASMVDDIAIIRSMNTDQFNHAPAELFLYTGNAVA